MEETIYVMDQALSGVAVVTGGGRGFGRAFAITLAENGMRVAVAARSSDQLEETVRLIRSQGGEAIAIPTDVTDAKAVASMVDNVETQLGKIELLVNSAGAGRPFGPTWETDPNEWWNTMEINLKGPLLCCAAVLRGMVERNRGRIINVASGAGTVSIPYMSAYVTSKAGLIRFTEVLADEARPHGVSVFAIQPGTVRTAMAEELLQSEAGERWLPWFKRIFDEGRDVTFEPAAALVLYLASGAADALSGRMFFAPGTPSEIVRHAEEVTANDLHVLRMRYFQQSS
jgi:NAD(P)-dependent dehydrogenase (short-subunit alcohol dehydrogenase family)